MVSLQRLNNYLEELLQSNSFDDNCPNGIQVEGKSEIKTLGVAVSASLSAIESAIENGCDALLVHHGMFWKHDSYRVNGIKKKKLKYLLDHGISLFAYHLPLDAHQIIGNNWHAAEGMGWENVKAFGDYNGTLIGVQGTFPEISIEDFQEHLEGYYHHTAHTALGGERTISSAALVSGGAHKMIDQAINAGVDCYITGSFDEPIWHSAFEEKINFFALGHSATERVGPHALGKKLKTEFSLAFHFFNIKNPF